jgi:DNA-binding LacI/PurR family transcriptional regulator
MDPLGHQTKYRHLANILRERLRSHPQGDKLPSVRSLMKRYRVSQHTVTSALRLLDEESLISRKHGSGVYANQANRPVTICFCRPQNANYQDDLREGALRDACATRGWQLLIDRFDALHADLFTDEVMADAFILPAELITYHSPLLRRLASNATPIVIMGRDTSSIQVDFVTGDDAPVIREFIMGLVKRGHRHIAYLDCEPAFYEVKKRVEYFLDICQMLQVETYPVLDVGAEYGLDSVAKSEAFLREYLRDLGRNPLPFTALLTGSMSGSIPAPLVFHQAGFRIPADLSLCCIGSDPRAHYAIPPISNAATHHVELAEAALEIVGKRLSGDKSPLLFKSIAYRAIWRESAGPPRKSRLPAPPRKSPRPEKRILQKATKRTKKEESVGEA